MRPFVFHHLLFTLTFLTGFSASAQSVNLRGTVSSGNGEPISGAIVTLLGMDLVDTTGDDGAYAISQTTPVMDPRSTAAGLVALTGSLLEFNLSKPTQLNIEVFDIKSNLLKSEKREVQEPGTYRWDIAKEYPSNQLLIVRASVAGEVTSFRFMPLAGGYSGSRLEDNASSKGDFLAKAAVAVDSLEIVAQGYTTKIVEVESYEATLDVELSQGGDRWGGPGNPPLLSSGCGSPQGITNGYKTIRNEGQDREYVIDIPSNYDPDKPYRFFYVSHWASGDARAMASNNYYAIKTQANAANEPAIFVAASGIGGFWGEEDHPLFDNILAHVEENLCIDRSRVFLIGYSFGGMISYSLSRNHQDKIRGVVGIAPANWNIWMPETTNEPIAWLQIHGLQDETCRWVNNESRREGGKYIVLEKAADNGCTIPGDDDFPVWQSGPHFCYEFEGCDEGYPVKICTNNERHSGAEKYRDPGESSSWVPPTAWEFFTRF